MTTTESPTAFIEELFCKGHPLDAVIAVGQDVGWTRDDVMTVLRVRQWDLDGSGRLPRSKRVTVPQGLRSVRPPAPATPPPPARRPRRPEEQLPRPVVDAPSIDEWTGPVVVDVNPPVDDELPAELPAPTVSRPSAAALSAIADWAQNDVPVVELPPAPPADEQPSPERERPRPAAAVPPDTDAAVARFLAERTVPAPVEQFLTSPDLRDAYEAWRGPADAPAVTTRLFGTALTARYRKKQSPVPIGGAKPMCYHGLAWKSVSAPLTCGCATLRPGEACPAHPFDPSAYKPRLVDVFLAEEAAASVALDGETHVIGGAHTAASARPASEVVLALEPDTDREALPEATSPTGAAPDLLAVGREHPDRRVRAAARAVEVAVDALCAALKRAS